ncbi:MAG: nucleoside kinase [Sphaerochaetaceae bacterium]|nr:nucleoside kinase [Sphaerochaetaceae bacterium]
MITISYHGKKYQADKYCSIGEFLEANDPESVKSLCYNDNPVVAGLANNEILPLSARLNRSFDLEIVNLFSELGKRIYRTSICFLLTYAIKILFPKRHIVICHSLGDGYYFTFDDCYVTTERTISDISAKMKEIVKLCLPIERNFLSYEDALKYFNKMGNEDTVALLKYSNDPDVECYRIGDYYDISMEVIVPNTSVITCWELMPYGDRGMLLRYPRSSNITEIRPFKDSQLLFSVFTEYKRWGKILGVQSVGKLDEICYDEKKISEYIRLSESLQARKIASIADEIDSRPVKTVLISGPSSSGKTTFANKLCIQLKMLGHDALRISLDNYYLSKELTPKLDDGTPDYEALEALDLDLFRENMADLMEGKQVRLPHYGFNKHGRSFDEKPSVLSQSSIIVVEGIHGLNPQLLPDFTDDSIYRIYISALTQINLDDHTRLSTTDNRLLRRLVRDARTRDTNALETLKMWPSVQDGAQRYIFPYQNNADIMLNSALDYELAVLARFAVPLLKMVKPSNEEYYTTARRLLKILGNVHPIQSSLVPKDSLLREFIGGSEFDD